MSQPEEEEIPVLSPEDMQSVLSEVDIGTLTAEQLEYLRQLQQASEQAVMGQQADMQGVEWQRADESGKSPGIASGVREDGPPPSLPIRPDSSKIVDSGWARDRQERESGDRWNYRQQYESAVADAMSQPVISVAAAAQVMAAPEQAEAVAQRLTEMYPGGFLSPAQVMRETQAQSFLSAVEARRAEGVEIPQEFVDGFVKRARSAPGALETEVMGVLSGNSPEQPSATAQRMAGDMRNLIRSHAPGGVFAAYGSRTDSEQRKLQADPTLQDGAHWQLTPEGKQSHDALRVAELLDANTPNYIPAHGSSQFLKRAGSVMAPAMDFLRGREQGRNYGAAWDEAKQLADQQGKYGYAVDLYYRGANDQFGDPSSVWTSDGLPKYYAYDPTNAMGLSAASTENTAFPVAWGYVNSPLRPITSEVGLHLNNMFSDKPVDFLPTEVADLRSRHKTVTPVTPDGVNPETQRKLGEQLTNADTRMQGYVSALAGPKFADAWNATLGKLGGGKAKRTYLTPFADTLQALPGEVAADPINLAANVAFPVAGTGIRAALNMARSGFMGAATKAGAQLVNKMATLPARVADDVVRETAQDATIISPALSGGFGDYFTKPQEQNLMMQGWMVDGKQGTPESPGYDEELSRRTAEARSNQREAAREWQRAKLNSR